MKKFSLLILSVAFLAMAGCSKKEETTTTSVPPQSTPDANRLKSDSERLQQATANAAKQREKESQAALSPTPTASP
jgi:hypothetical protein